MDKKMYKLLTEGMDYGTWWVSENIISIDEVEKIEDMITGEVIYEKGRK